MFWSIAKTCYRATLCLSLPFILQSSKDPARHSLKVLVRLHIVYTSFFPQPILQCYAVFLCQIVHQKAIEIEKIDVVYFVSCLLFSQNVSTPPQKKKKDSSQLSVSVRCLKIKSEEAQRCKKLLKRKLCRDTSVIHSRTAQISLAPIKSHISFFFSFTSLISLLFPMDLFMLALKSIWKVAKVHSADQIYYWRSGVRIPKICI